ncbi:MAG: hypothetical protein WCI74_15920, partial [Actinomycetes bacterium]
GSPSPTPGSWNCIPQTVKSSRHRGAEVASIQVKAGFVGGSHVAIANQTWPDSPAAFKVDRAFAKAMQQAWTGPKSTLPAESTTVSRAVHQRLGMDYWFCDACGQPCGSPNYSETPREKCDGCCRNVTGIRA